MKRPSPNHAISWSEVKRPIVCLAPMDGVTNSAFRQIVRTLSKDVILFSVNSQALMAWYEANMYVCAWTMNHANNLFSCSFSATLQKCLQKLPEWWQTVEYGA